MPLIKTVVNVDTGGTVIGDHDKLKRVMDNSNSYISLGKKSDKSVVNLANNAGFV